MASLAGTARYEELRRLLSQAAHAYYVVDCPSMDDGVYDRLYRELLELEAANPGLINADSPSQRVGGSPAAGFQSVAHRIGLLSLDNAFNSAELSSCYAKLLLVPELEPSS